MLWRNQGKETTFVLIVLSSHDFRIFQVFARSPLIFFRFCLLLCFFIGFPLGVAMDVATVIHLGAGHLSFVLNTMVLCPKYHGPADG